MTSNLSVAMLHPFVFGDASTIHQQTILNSYSDGASCHTDQPMGADLQPHSLTMGPLDVPVRS
jgi:hypothetical protein